MHMNYHGINSESADHDILVELDNHDITTPLSHDHDIPFEPDNHDITTPLSIDHDISFE